MEELFRFSLSRPAARSDVPTLALPKGNLQEHLPGVPTWDRLETFAWASIRDDVNGIRSAYDESAIKILRKYLLEVQTSPHEAWPEIVRKLVDALAGQINQLRQRSQSLADLFIALLILRS